MNWVLRRVTNQVMGAFVGSGVSLDLNGQLCLPDGLCPDRVRRFIELCTDERFTSPRAAMSDLFRRVGVDPHAVGVLDEIIDANGTVDIAAAAKQSGALMSALPELRKMPSRFRDFLVEDLGLAASASESLEQAVVSARQAAARRVGCDASWDAILEYHDALGEMARPWRERSAAA